MDCSACAGACCEEMQLPLRDFRPPDDDKMRWYALHADELTSDHYLRFECRCTMLSGDGSCSIYDDRPRVCRDFERGGPDCLDVVRRRRTPAEYALIRDDGDPTVAKLYEGSTA